MYSAQGIFQHHFQCIKVHTIMNKIRYLIICIRQTQNLTITVYEKTTCQFQIKFTTDNYTNVQNITAICKHIYIKYNHIYKHQSYQNTYVQTQRY